MSAEHAYGEALARMDDTAAVGLKAAVEALRDDNPGLMWEKHEWEA